MNIKTDGLIARGDKIAVALSGGKDSIALFYALCEMEERLGIRVLAINVEHGIRGEESVADSEFVKNTCDNMRKRLLFYSVDAPTYAEENGLGLEEAARELRYECFKDALDKGLCDKIATAHHQSDLCETVLLNIFRGSGLNGLAGVPETALGGRVIRPLLEATREQIDAYIAQKQLKFVTDSSNLDQEYSRNFIRNSVMPKIKERYPAFEKSVAALSELCREEGSFLDGMASELVSESCGESKITLSPETSPVILRRAAVIAMKRAGLKKDYERVHVDAVVGLALLGTGASVDLPHGYRATKDYGYLSIYKYCPAEFEPFEFKEGTFELCGGTLTVERRAFPDLQKMSKAAFFSQEKGGGRLYVRAEGLCGATVRQRKEGDEIAKFGGGTVSLKELFIDLKIERRLRDRLPVCELDGRIVFVGGVEVSREFCALEGEDVFLIQYERGEI